MQVAAVVNDIADVDGLLVRAGAADALQGVLHGHGGLQIHELRGHDAAGGVLRVFENLVDALAHVRVGVLQNPLDHVGGHFLHDVHRVVQIQLVQHFFQLRVGKALDQQLLLVAVQLHEYLRGLLLGQQAEQQGQLFVSRSSHRMAMSAASMGSSRSRSSVYRFRFTDPQFFPAAPPIFHFKHTA